MITMRAAKRSLLALVAAPVLLLAWGPVSASATAPWWHLALGARPASIVPGSARDEVWQFTVSSTWGEYTLRFDPDRNEGPGVDASFTWNETHEEMQAELEGLFGAGNVEVAGGPGDATGSTPYIIKFVGAFADQPVFIARSSNNVHSLTLTELAHGRPDGKVTLTAANLGDAPVDGVSMPVILSDILPTGFRPVTVNGTAGPGYTEGIRGENGVLKCTQPGGPCVFSGGLCQQPEISCAPNTGLLQPFEALHMTISFVVEPNASTDGVNEANVSGGGLPPDAASRTVPLGSAEASFGIAKYDLMAEEEGGALDRQAASHPFQFTTTLTFNQTLGGLAPAMVKDLHFNLPAGLIGNPTLFPQCPIKVFQRNECPPDTMVGVARIMVGIVEFNIGAGEVKAEPIYNVEPSPGEPARFGFGGGGPTETYIDTALRNGGDYGVTVSASNITEEEAFTSEEVTFWGVPGDSRHDLTRGSSLGEKVPPPFLTMPSSCEGPMQSAVEAASWKEPGVFDSFSLAEPMAELGECERVPFTPSLKITPDVQSASTPSGLAAEVHLPQELSLNPTGLAEANVKDTTVTLPEGLALNPSGADGLGACTEAEIGYMGRSGEALEFTPDSPTCPESSRVGSVEIHTPLLDHPVKGWVYVAKQSENPFGSLLALYLVADDPISGTLLKLAGEVSLDPQTGRVTTAFRHTPQLPFEDLTLHFFGGSRAPLGTPAACGPYSATASLMPWSASTPTEASAPPFELASGPNGGPCPSGGLPPFHPNLIAGTTSNTAGRYSPFVLALSREDTEQEITHFSLKLPPGLTGNLSGIARCSDQEIEKALSRRHEGGGTEEEANPSCSAASAIGHTMVGAGLGPLQVYVPGKLYLAGPYHGSPLSVVAITAAKTGPFDLGTVVVREALRVNPETAEVFVDATGSDPIPHIIDGVPIHARQILVFLDRHDFILNPTSCEPTSIASTVLGSGLDFTSEADDVPVTVTSPFQAADCAALPFHPRLKIRLIGKTTRGSNPALRAEVTQSPGEASIGRAAVTLPRTELLENAHIRTICTRVQFKEAGGNGEACPPGSVYGRARAITPILSEPLEGPVFLRSNGGERQLPDLVAALHGQEINIDLVGRIDSVHGRIRNTFETIPDAPVTSFVLEMAGGKKSLLANSTELCKAKPHVTALFTGHNGKIDDFRPLAKPDCRKRKRRR